MDRAQFEVLGVRIDALTPDSTLSLVEEAVAGRRKTSLAFCTVSSVLSARDDPLVKQALESAVVTPDGMPLVWLGRKRHESVERVYGPDFMMHLLGSTGPRYAHFFYGGGPGVAEEMADRLKRRFPALRVAGVHSPPMGLVPADPPPHDIAMINDSGADIVWVGIGHPKQELFMYLNRERLDAPVLAGVGAAFDFHAGRTKEAPGWMKRSGLQWLHRMGKEPRRLWRRYLLGNTRFVVLLARERLTRKT
ncbi:MAG: WecB/TagA/CpsF family glycosyltransferase [Actinomycetota bacterium]|nr:WecB/TagA/CpsF family glycosyltransferase [Actinomycetota bacterium]